MWPSVLFIICSAGTLYAVYRILDSVVFYFVIPSEPLKACKRAHPDRAWALVTGASGGIGLGIATELLKNDFGVILLDHIEDELNAVKRSLESSIAGAAIRTVVMDATTATNDEISSLVKSLESLTTTILVNNVGGIPVSGAPTRELSTYTLADVDRIIDINARFMTRLTAAMLPILGRQPISSGQQSLIINMSSGASTGMPWLSIYGATKSYIRAFSHGLARELEFSSDSKHVKCLSVIPGDVLSQSNRVGVPQGAPEADEYGKWIVWTLDGAMKRRMRDLVPYWKHSLQITALSWLSDGIITDILLKVMETKKRAWEEHHTKVR